MRVEAGSAIVAEAVGGGCGELMGGSKPVAFSEDRAQGTADGFGWAASNDGGGTDGTGRHGEWAGLGSAASGRGWAWGMGTGSRPGGTGGYRD